MNRITATLLSAIALLSLAGPLTKKLIRDGGESGLVAPESISFCNVLFVGNLCGGVLALFMLGARGALAELRSTGLRTWLLLLVNVGLAVAIPTLIFTALASTTVTNVILLGRFESIAFVALGLLFGGAAPGRRAIVGYSVIATGIVVLILLEGMGKFMRGDILVIVAAVLQGLAAHIARSTLKRTTLRVFVFLRNFGSAIVFFIFAITLYGFEHFEHAFRPGLWQLMVVYALVVIVAAQIAWYWSLGKATPGTIANLSLLGPLFGISFAYLLLQEVPTGAQIQGGVIILVGMLISKSRGVPPVESSLGAIGCESETKNSCASDPTNQTGPDAA